MARLTKNRAGAWLAFLQAHSKVILSLEAEMLEDQGLPLTWFDILTHLEIEPEGKMRMQTLADNILLSRSGLTRLFDRMAKEGLVNREPCLEDRRGTYAVITPKGLEALAKAKPGHLRGIFEHFLSKLDDSDVDAVQKALAKVLRYDFSD
jgi:DNA-binding MarR family transcriptional regulator